MDKMYEMSFFNGPITNKVPLTTLGLVEVAAIVKNKELEPQTVLLRSIIGHEAARQYKQGTGTSDSAAAVHHRPRSCPPVQGDEFPLCDACGCVLLLF